MKVLPILFSTAMVQALLDGRKTQTRRIVKPQTAILTDEIARSFGVQPPLQENQPVIKCPYGKPGDLLWVRESFAMSGLCWPKIKQGMGKLHYKASDKGEWKKYWGGWKPSIHMPRWGSRITLEIINTRVERLNSISRDDCMAEGLTKWPHEDDYAYGYEGSDWAPGHATPTGAYYSLWEDINGKGSWKLNPWVWVVEFRVHLSNIDQFLTVVGEVA